MKYIKIGRSSANDVVLNDPTVSTQHAIITVLDTKEIRIKDLNSTNGTYVNGRLISSETTITTNDYIRLGNCTLDWLKYINPRPQPPVPVFPVDSSANRRKKTIGSMTSNDIVLSHSDVSRNHAQLMENDRGEIVIADCGSTNGTYVNGMKISTHTLRPGDRIMIANKYMLDWEQLFPASGKKGNTKKIVIPILISAAAVVAVIVGFAIYLGSWWTANDVHDYYNNSVVMITAKWTYHVSTSSGNIGNFHIDGDGKLAEGAVGLTGTGFFVSENGKIITNKHVAAIDDKSEEIKDFFQRYYMYQARETGNRQYISLAQSVRVTLNMLEYGIIRNNTHYTGARDVIPCKFLKTYDSDEIDVAIIQTNSQTLPAGVKINVVNLDKAIVVDKNIKINTKVYLMGFPLGQFLATTSSGIKADFQPGTITQTGSDFYFRHNAVSFGGASGSPIFEKRGRLIGIHYAGLAQAGVHGYGRGIKAKYAVDLAK